MNDNLTQPSDNQGPFVFCFSKEFLACRLDFQTWQPDLNTSRSLLPPDFTETDWVSS
jgi:hypothetical protein